MEDRRHEKNDDENPDEPHIRALTSVQWYGFGKGHFLSHHSVAFALMRGDEEHRQDNEESHDEVDDEDRRRDHESLV